MKKRKITAFEILAHAILILVTLAVILPFILLFMSSITEEKTLLVNGYSFFPRKFSLESYIYIFQSFSKIMRAYGVTVFISITGTTVSLIISSMMAYALSVKGLPFKRTITFFVFFTMLFNGGLVPTYMTYTSVFHIKDTIFGLIVPSFLLSAWNVLLIRTCFQTSIPDSLFEAAQIDGAGQFKIFASIVIPLGKPILVTMGTFTALAYWNDWTNGLYYLGSRTDLYSIQNLLNKMITDLQFLTSSSVSGNISGKVAEVPATGVQMAIAFVAMIPILVIFPFLQKYYQKGIALGAVKG